MICPRCKQDYVPYTQRCAGCGLSFAASDDATQPPSATTGPGILPPPLPHTPVTGTTQARDSILDGTTIGPSGRYRIIRRIGQGGFAETFYALDTQLFDGPCVIKRLRLDPTQPAHVHAVQIESLSREAELLVALKTPGHPNIPDVYAYLSDEYCLVMKYVEGISLRAQLNQRSNGFPEDVALRYVHEACSALVYMHARHTLHLDVKPDNLICDSSGRLWLIDFGIGRSVHIPEKAMALGTPGYSPMEQWQGNPAPCSDIYALGVTLYVLLTNHRPTTSGQLNSLVGQTRALPPLRQLVPTVRPEVEDLVWRATNPDHNQRPSATEMLDELRLLRTRMGVPRPTQPPNLDKLLGRDAQVVQAWDVLELAGAVAIVGMPGVGKTALAVALARHIERPEHVFWHSFRPEERFETLLWSLAAFLAWDGHTELWELLHRTNAQTPPPQVVLDYLLSQLRDHPYLICLDDLHHAEADPIIARCIEGFQPLVHAEGPRLIATTRRVLELRWPAECLVLTGLDHSAAHELLAQFELDLTSRSVDQLIAVTAGNPQLLFLAADALRHTSRSDEIIDRLAEVENIERYLLREVDSGLDEDKREAMRAISALIGAPGSRDLLEEMVGCGLRRPLRTLLDRHLIVITETAHGPLYVQHAIVQSFYYGDLSASERRTLHQRAAAYFEREPADDLWAARHHAAAGATERAATLATHDIWGAVNRGQSGTLQAILQQLPAEKLDGELRLQIYLARGELATLLSDSVPAQAAYESAFDLLAEMPDSTTRRTNQAQVCRGLGELLESQMPQQALAWVERGLEMLGDTDQHQAALLRQRAGSVLIGMGQNKAAHVMLEQGLMALPPTADAQRADILTNLAIIAWLQGDSAQGEVYAREALNRYERVGQRWKMITVWQNLGMRKHYAGDWSGAAAEYAHAMEEANALGSVMRQTELVLCLGVLANNQGDGDRAQHHFDRCVTLARQHQMHEQLSLGLSSLADLHLREGRWHEAKVALDEAATLATHLDLRYQLSEISRERAELYLAQDEVASAIAAAEVACAHARAQENPCEEGMGLRVLGVAQLVGGWVEEALSSFAASVELLESQDPYEAARTQAVWGAACRDATGAELLCAARATFAQLGAKRDLEAIVELLRQRGGSHHEDDVHSLGRLPTSDHHSSTDKHLEANLNAGAADSNSRA